MNIEWVHHANHVSKTAISFGDVWIKMSDIRIHIFVIGREALYYEQGSIKITSSGDFITGSGKYYIAHSTGMLNKMTSLKGTFFALLDLCAGNSPVMNLIRNLYSEIAL